MEPMHERERDRIRVRPKREGPGRARAVIAPRFEHRGQSMTEFALVLPALLILALGALNVGLAIRAQLQLAQVAQQAAQYLVHHPEYGDADTYLVTLSGAGGGTFTLTTSGGSGGGTTSPALSSTVSAATVQSELAALPNVGTGNVTVTSPGAGGPFTVTFGGTATVSGLTADGSSLHPAAATVTAAPTTYDKLVTYMNTLSSYQLTPLEVTLSKGTSTLSSASCSSTNNCVQQDTITVNYPFPLVFPLLGRLSVGSLRNGALHLGATASTIAATHPVNSVTACTVVIGSHKAGCSLIHSGPTNGWTEIDWSPPIEATTLSLPLWYCIERAYWTNPPPTPSTLVDTKYYPGTKANGNALPSASVNQQNCVAGLAGSGSQLSFVDPGPSSTGWNGKVGPKGRYYIITVEQLNGLQSPPVQVTP